MALGSVLAACVSSADFVSSAVEPESWDLAAGGLVAFASAVCAAALLAVDWASICRKFGAPPAACVELPELDPALAPAVAPVLPDLLDFPGELAPPPALEPLEPLAALQLPLPSDRPEPLVPPELPDPPGALELPAPLDPLPADRLDGALVLDPVAVPLELAPVPDAAPEPAPALAAPPRSVAMPLLEVREAAPVGAGGEGEIDLRPTPMHSVRARAL